MKDVPELTDDEATVLRYWAANIGVPEVARRGLMTLLDPPDLSAEGRAALAAYDAKQRAKIENALLVELAGDLPGRDLQDDDTATRAEAERDERTMLARHRAKIRSQIRVEAMREIKAEVEALASAFRKLGDPFPEALAASRTILRGIDEKIAKEQSQ